MPDPLHRVTELYARREQDALRRLAEARQRERKAAEDLERIHNIGSEYRRELGTRGRAGIVAAELKHWRGFIVQLERGVGRQQDLVDRVQQQTAQVEQHWLQARKNAAAMATVQERRDRELEVRERRREQRQQDEFAANGTRKRADEGDSAALD